MKKGLIVLLMVALVAPMFAEEAAFDPSVSLSGFGKAVFGINLDEGTTGFTNEYEAKIEVVLVPEVEDTKSEEGISGEIKLKEAKMILKDEQHGADAGEFDSNITIDYAQVNINDMWVKVYGTPDVKVDFSEAIGFLPLAEGVTDVADGSLGGQNALWLNKNDVVAEPAWKSGGLALGYESADLFKVEVEVASYMNEQAVEDDENANKYAVKGLVGVLAVENLTVEGAFAYYPKAATFVWDATPAITNVIEVEDSMALGGKVSYKVDLGNDMYVEPIVGFDMKNTGKTTDTDLVAVTVTETDAKSEWTLGNAVRLGWAGYEDKEIKDIIGLADGKVFSTDDEKDVKAWTGLTVGYQLSGSDVSGSEVETDIIVSTVETRDEGLVANLGWIVSYAMENVTEANNGTAQSALLVGGDYKVSDMISVYAAYDTELTKDAKYSQLWAGIEASDIVPHVSVGADYVSGNLSTDVDRDTDAGIYTEQNGIVKTWVKVSY